MPKKNTAYSFYLGLIDSANRPQFRANPTLAAGDFKVSVDGGALANLTNLPTVTPAGGRLVQISLTAGEMNGDRIVVQAVDAAGGEWDEAIVTIDTDAVTIDELVRSATPANAIAVDASGRVDVGKWVGSAPNALQAGRVDGYLGAAANGVITAAVAPNLDAAVSTRAPAATALSTADWTAGRAGNLDRLDVAVSTRGTGDATAANQTIIIGYVDSLETRLTSQRAANLDFLDAAITTRAAAATALSTADWTPVRAGKLDFLDAAITTRSTLDAAGVWAHGPRTLTATGLDAIVIDGKTLPLTVAYAAAGVAGRVSGAGTGTEVFKGLDGATTRLTITVDASGNRTNVVYG